MSSFLTNLLQSIKDLPPHSTTITLCITSFCSFILLRLTPTVNYFPQTYEQHVLWECLTIGGSKSINCVQVDSLLESPLLPILSGLLSYLFPPAIGIGILFWFFCLWTIAILWKLGSSIGGYWVGLCSTVVFLSVSISTNLLSLVSPEFIYTPFVLTALYTSWKTKTQNSNLQMLVLGFFVSLSYFFTTTAFLYIIAICGIAILLASKKTDIVALLAGCIVLPFIWHLFLSVYTNSLFINTRIDVSEAEKTIPESFVRQIFGEGFYKTSLQSISYSEKISSITGTLLPDIEVLDILNTIQIIMERLPLFMLLCTVATTLLFLYEQYFEGRLKRLVQSGIILFIVGIIQSLYGNDQQVLLLSLLPAIAIGSLIIGVVVSNSSVPVVKRYSPLLMVIISFLIAMNSTPQKIFNIEQSNSGRDMIDWISKNTDPRESIVSTRINTPLLILANRKWIQYTSPLDTVAGFQNPPRHILISMNDTWYTGKVKGIGRVQSYFFDDNEWYGIFEYSSPTR